MQLRRAVLEELEVPLVSPFETSFGRESTRRVLFVTLESTGGEEGIGECAASREPLYSSETVGTAREVIERHLLGALRELEDPTAETFLAHCSPWKGNRMARATVEMALQDLGAREAGVSLARQLKGTKSRVEVGVSVGIYGTPPAVVRAVRGYLDDGYGRVKLKVRPGWDERPLAAVRRDFPDVRLWTDANQAYGRRDLPSILRWARAHRVEQVEQPFPERSISDHAALVAAADFRVCLDESIVDDSSLTEALALRALTALNVKPGRVGGHLSAIQLARHSRQARIPAWVGGMLETGVGRAHALALASRPEFTLPADLSASARYYARDLVDPPFELGPGSTLSVPKGPGLGVSVVESRWRKARRRRTVVPL